MENRLAFIASATEPVNSYTQPDLWVIDLVKEAKPRNLTEAFDWDVGASVFGDNAAPRGGGGNVPIWSPDGKSIIENFAKEGQTNLGSFDVATGALTEITKGQSSHRAISRRARQLKAGLLSLHAHQDRRFVLARSR